MLEHTVAVAALQELKGWYLRPLDIKQLWLTDLAQIVVAFDKTPGVLIGPIKKHPCLSNLIVAHAHVGTLGQGG